MYRNLTLFEISISGNISKDYLTVLMSNAAKDFYVKLNMFSYDNYGKNEGAGTLHHLVPAYFLCI